ncbi:MULTISPECIES: pyroglutamyl-peptidase I [Lysinibacillus]|jgi:pyroglutamyl-peptidase|uniref:pyroglutamyl-peptidase I n=1 Tax=Lysinibacillus TaxID=400634 RepID=UPI0004D97B35|nr:MULTISPECIES: pyroglutamyl-peptidase I [Lysinibacillus]MDC6266127.1 pyroglutamyl-peptidase I [Lysinibacillus sphaericus]AJK88441.1 peptidase C15 [Lysinibacillus fusiformis]KAB0441369.1 pyroglutamyl-peptidase I [Lysinibacillus fusiformis]KGA83316.1 peptidase C15 [Lysinibacillus fusiformis]KHK56005.1 peptidase C15 [Lysinibacillus sp. A1]
MTNILLTGFEPFLDYKLNPTMQIVENLNGEKIEDYHIIGRILSVDFQQSAEQLKQYIEEIEPQIIISLGLAGGRYKLTPERIAINVKDGEPDNNGYTPVDESIQEKGADAYLTNLPIRQMVNRLQAEGYPAEISNTAGTYLCNNIMYEGLVYAQQHEGVRAGFIHIPASFELAIQHGKIPGWHIRDLIAAVKLCIEETIRAGNH